jgi:hypothetical protein
MRGSLLRTWGIASRITRRRMQDVGVPCCMAYLTDWRILLAFLLLVLAIAIMVHRSEKRWP